MAEATGQKEAYDMDSEHIECQCKTCTEDRAEFNAWADAFGLRWEAHKQANAELAAEVEGIRATLHADCGPLCPECGSPLDTSILGLAPR